MITELDLEVINKEEYKLITYKEFIDLLSYDFEYIHIVSKDDFLYIETKRMISLMGIGGSYELKRKLYNYDYYRVENK